MKRLVLFCAAAGLMLGSASLPHGRRDAAPPRLPYILTDCVATIPYSCAPVAGADAAAEGDPSVETLPLAEAEPEPKPAKRDAVAVVSDDDDALRIVISLPRQRLWVFEGDELVASSRVSTGKPGHRTPVGTFRILQKQVHHHSNIYDNAPMPYMQRLTNYGIALHAGHVPGYPASHGCIRMPWSFAKKLYKLTDKGTRVIITKKRLKSAEEALDLA